MLLECTDFINGAITAPNKNVDDDRPFESTFKTSFKSSVSRENVRWPKTQKAKTH